MGDSIGEMEYLYIGVGIKGMGTMGVQARNKEIHLWHCYGRWRLNEMA